MSWVNDLASGMGIPAGAATLAVAMYAACAAAEKAARPEALHDIACILNDSSWVRSVRPSAIIERVFVWTFGERHLSWRCFKRSMFASILFLITLALLDTARDFGRTGELDIAVPKFERGSLFFMNFVMVSIGGVLPDYVALGKSRFLIWLLRFTDGGAPIVIFLIFDVAISCVISLFATGFVFLYYTIGGDFIWSVFPKSPFAAVERLVVHTSGLVEMYFSGKSQLPVFGLLFLSTLFTSVWTILILLSTIALKLLAPVHRLTAWFFDIDKHPVKAIGIVAGALVMVGSLIWSVLRVVI